MEIKRSIHFPVIAIFIYVFLYSSCLSFSQPTTNNTSLLDVDGNEVQSHTKYYIFSAGGHGGGLALSARDYHYPCPHNVMEETDQNSVGLSLEIFPIDGHQEQQSIKLSTNVNILFKAATVCVQSTVWQLGGVDPFTGRRYIRSNGEMGRPGRKTVRNWFKIEKHGSGKGYSIVYCPSVCSACYNKVSLCGEVGVFVENGKRWLGLGGEPLLIVFKKVLL